MTGGEARGQATLEASSPAGIRASAQHTVSPYSKAPHGAFLEDWRLGSLTWARGVALPLPEGGGEQGSLGAGPCLLGPVPAVPDARLRGSRASPASPRAHSTSGRNWLQGLTKEFTAQAMAHSVANWLEPCLTCWGGVRAGGFPCEVRALVAAPGLVKVRRGDSSALVFSANRPAPSTP